MPREKLAEADKIAFEHDPENRPDDLGGGAEGGKGRLVVERRVYWGGERGAHLTVGFLDSPAAELRAKILAHMNAWSKTANVSFVETRTDPQVRIARLESPFEPGGCWSYSGTDILTVEKDRPTMNLEGFTMATPDAEFCRIVRHETGHTLGFPHEHMRAQLVELLDPEKVVEHFMQTQGWSREDVIAQVLTPLEESSILGGPGADAHSIMCYQIPGHLTKDGKAIAGGSDINDVDYAITASLYPKPKPLKRWSRRSRPAFPSRSDRPSS